MSEHDHSTTLLLDAGHVLALLDHPMDQAEVRRFAERAVDFAATVEGGSDPYSAVYGWLQPQLTKRGAMRHHIDLVARAVLHVVEHALTLTEARRVLGAMWAGYLLGNGG